jgi:glycosyltransferase involved in cell wall biosynthesis
MISMSVKPLNILQTCFSPSWGGLEMQALEVTKHLRNRGHQVWLACCNGSRLQQESERLGISTISLPVKGYVHPILVHRLKTFLVKEKIQIIHSQLSKDLATVVPAMKFTGRHIPIILSKRIGSGIMKKTSFHRFTYGNVSKVLAISSLIHRNVIETTPILPEKVITLHDAVDTNQFSPSRVDRDRVRKEFRYTNEQVVIGFVGRFSPGKGQEEFIEAAAVLKKQYPILRFLMVGEESYGEPQYFHDMKAMASRLGLDDVVTFAGFRRDIPEVMASFDIFAMPSHAESFGVVLIEAMAMERPVVSTNNDGILDIVVDGVTGIYVNPRNSAELASALSKLVDDPSLREHYGKAGRKRVLELFDQSKQISKIEQIYTDLL